MSKIVLGTVQFGIDYGINNQSGRVSEQNVFSILDYANTHEIDMLDTAPVYGDSEQVLGRYLKQKNSFKIISKIPRHINHVIDAYNSSIKNLSIHQLYGYLFHSYDTFIENPQLYDQLLALKTQGKIKKIGFSLYYPNELDYLLDHRIEFDLIQIPYNIFDQRFQAYFKILKEKNVEIHVRSIFLQGLFFKDPNTLSDHFSTVKEKLLNLHKFSKINKIPLNALCLLFGCSNQSIDKVVLGVDSIANLMENIAINEYQKIFTKIKDDLLNLSLDDENILLPFKWK